MSIMEAKEEVMMTRVMVGLWVAMAVRMLVVPWMAGSRRSRSLSETDVWKGEAVWMTWLWGLVWGCGDGDCVLWGWERGKTYPVDAFDGFVESAGYGYVLDDGEGEGVAVFGVGFAHFVGAGFVAHRAADFVALLEEFVQNVGGNEAGGAGDEDGLTGVREEAVGVGRDGVLGGLGGVLDGLHFCYRLQ